MMFQYSYIEVIDDGDSIFTYWRYSWSYLWCRWWCSQYSHIEDADDDSSVLVPTEDADDKGSIFTY